MIWTLTLYYLDGRVLKSKWYTLSVAVNYANSLKEQNKIITYSITNDEKNSLRVVHNRISDIP